MKLPFATFGFDIAGTITGAYFCCSALDATGSSFVRESTCSAGLSFKAGTALICYCLLLLSCCFGLTASSEELSLKRFV